MSTTVKLIRPEDRIEGQQTPGMHREQAQSASQSWSGYVTTDAGTISGWHHHGDYETHIYVLSGVMRIETDSPEKEIIEAHEGDFIFVPPHTTHREINPGSEQSKVVVVRAGKGEPVFNVDAPK